jgi:hypothetical protein
MIIRGDIEKSLLRELIAYFKICLIRYLINQVSGACSDSLQFGRKARTRRNGRRQRVERRLALNQPFAFVVHDAPL